MLAAKSVGALGAVASPLMVCTAKEGAETLPAASAART